MKARRYVRLVIVATLFVVAQPLVGPAQAVSNPAARWHNGMATDPATGNVLMFGGRSATTSYLDETWTWNGNVWTLETPTTRPRGRTQPAMAEDPTTGTVLLFGGQTTDTHLTDTWIWDGAAKTWAQPVLLFSPKFSPYMAYDGAGRKIVLVVPVVSGLIQTWTWDGETRSWAQEAPVDAPSEAGPIAYDPVSRRVILYTAVRAGDDDTYRSETWTWDGIAKTWTKEATSTSPSPRYGVYMAFHAASSKVVMFGGGRYGTGLEFFDATWSWDGQTRSWTKQKPLNRPCPRADGRMAYHPSTKQAVIFGGYARRSPCPSKEVSDTWAWNGVNWKQRA